MTGNVTALASAVPGATFGVPGSPGRLAGALKLAVTVVAVLTVTAQVPVPEQAPLQPAKDEPAAGVAVRVMAVPGVTDCEQAVPQLMPAGLLVTVPEPVPLFVIDSVSGAAGGAGTRRLAHD